MKATMITKLLAVMTLSSSIASASPRMLRTGAPACGNLKDDTPACDRVRALLDRESIAQARIEARRAARQRREEVRRIALERRTRQLFGLPAEPELAITVTSPRTYENGAPANGNVASRKASRARELQ